MARKAVIIGSGLGGLECGCLLARRGWDVTVLERHSRTGGCLQTFRRGDKVFNTGVHFIGALDDPCFEPFGFSEIRWEKLEGEEAVIGTDSFFLPSGYDAWTEALASAFPSGHDAVSKVASLFKNVAAESGLESRGALEYLESTVRDPLLRQVISATSLKMELSPRLPLQVFARINDSFIRGIWRPADGACTLAEHLTALLECAGGRVLTGAEVTEVMQDRVLSTKGEFEADVIVSDIHPARLVEMAPGIRSVYRRRVSSLRNTGGFKTFNLALSSGECIPRSLFIHREDADLWRPSAALESAAVCFGNGTADIMTRADVTLAEVLDFVAPRLPWLPAAVEACYESTPETWERYTGTPGGSAYGIERDWAAPLTTMLSVRTPQPNLFLTGQNVGIHGLMGVTESATRTVNEIINAI